MLVPRLDKRLGILHVWMKDFESQMITEEISGHRRDALMPSHLGEVISRELKFLKLPHLSEFVSHSRELFDLLYVESPDDEGEDSPDDPEQGDNNRTTTLQFVRREPGALPRQLPVGVLHSITCAAAMATCSKGCYRGGNIAVGGDFIPSGPTVTADSSSLRPCSHWTRQQAAAMADMVRSGNRIALPKPRTKGSQNKSSKARKLARMPQAFEHAPDDPLDLPTLFYIMCWLIPVKQVDWASTPVFKGVLSTSASSISTDELTLWIRTKLEQHHPCLAKLLHVTQYSARIGMATVLALVATPEELDVFGAWASDIGRTVYARMTAERSLQIMRATMKIQDVTLESLEPSVFAASTQNEVVTLPTASGNMPQVSAIRPLYAPAPIDVDQKTYDSWSAGATSEAVVQDNVQSPATVRALQLPVPTATRKTSSRDSSLLPGATPHPDLNPVPRQKSKITHFWPPAPSSHLWQPA